MIQKSITKSCPKLKKASPSNQALKKKFKIAQEWLGNFVLLSMGMP
jgi:hypothetical protein